jgi:hypothetical protein
MSKEKQRIAGMRIDWDGGYTVDRPVKKKGGNYLLDTSISTADFGTPIDNEDIVCLL